MGDVLHTNLPNAPNGSGYFLVCRVGEDGEPDLSDVWVVNGMIFPDNYYIGNMRSAKELELLFRTIVQNIAAENKQKSPDIGPTFIISLNSIPPIYIYCKPALI